MTRRRSSRPAPIRSPRAGAVPPQSIGVGTLPWAVLLGRP